MEYGLVRVSALRPEVRAGEVERNVASCLEVARRASNRGSLLNVAPECCLTGYSCEDLFFNANLLARAKEGLAAFAAATAELYGVYVVGLPVAWNGRLYNAAAVCAGGNLWGLVTKTFLPGSCEFYDPRWFVSGKGVRGEVLGARLGSDVLFEAEGICFGVELCEDLWAPSPPSGDLALGGAEVILNPSASPELSGKADYRRGLVESQSARLVAGYVYSGAGCGESSTDLVFGGHGLIAENGRLLAESVRFGFEPAVTTADLDVELLRHERLLNSGFRQTRIQLDRIPVSFAAKPPHPGNLLRPVSPTPFAADAKACEEVLAIQSTGLAIRMRNSGIRRLVLGLSGGLDSTLALIVSLEALRRLGEGHENLLCLTMPSFATGSTTLGLVKGLCQRLSVPLEEIHIEQVCALRFGLLGHDGCTPDITYENVQARERTQLLLDKANQIGALLVGTGDLSELALGWCTYGGDHLSHYGVNAGVPKTLVRAIVAWYARRSPAREILERILELPITPELIPGQETERSVGPYELHDFFLYCLMRYGFSAPKISFLARHAFRDRYTGEEIAHWLKVFLRRFATQQFKRSCLPDGPKVGSINLSPRGDWRMVSDLSPSALGADA
ncbi:MAG: NAD(+) synthase [Kiritimatiellia bacterium]|nr:NAD(+) synthase [Kiritimatiellia bacterium]